MFKNFIDQCLAGEILANEIDDVVDLWHEGGTGMTLREYIGFSKEEYSAWLMDDDVLPLILSCRKKNVPFTLPNQAEQSLPLAARSMDAQDQSTMLQWLREHDYIEH